MDEEGRKPVLPAVVDVSSDESLMSLAIRNAHLNEYPTPTWIGDLVGRELPAALREEAIFPALASAFRMEESEVRRRSYVRVGDGGCFPGEPLRNFWGHVVSQSFIDQGRVWLCPACFQDSPHLRGYWSLILYRACHIHGNALIWRCPACSHRAPIDYRRRHPERCSCGQDLSKLKLPAARTAEVDLARYLHARMYALAPRAKVGSLSEAFATAPLGDFMRGIALLLAQLMNLRTVEGLRGILDHLSHDGYQQTSEALPDVLSILENWPQALDSYVAATLGAAGPGVDIGHRARATFKPLMTWTLPASLHSLTSRIDIGVARRRQELFRMVLGDEFQQGDERTHLPVVDAAAILGIRHDEVHTLVPTYALLGRRSGNGSWSRLMVADTESVHTICEGLKHRIAHSFAEPFEEVVNFDEAKRIAGSFGRCPRDLTDEILSGAIRCLGESGLPVSLGSIRINYLDTLRWAQGVVSPRSVSFSKAASIAVLDHATLEAVCRGGHINCEGEKGYPDPRAVDLASLRRFREAHRIASRTVEGARLGRTRIAERIADRCIKSVAGSHVGGKAFVLHLDEMRRLVESADKQELIPAAS